MSGFDPVGLGANPSEAANFCGARLCAKRQPQHVPMRRSFFLPVWRSLLLRLVCDTAALHSLGGEIASRLAYTQKSKGQNLPGRPLSIASWRNQERAGL